ncbi:hypothetical protein GCM10027085_07250 [Spirosoma aerophilum]
MLEAVAIQAEQGNELPTIRTLLRKRGEFYPDFDKQSSLPEKHLSSLKSLFTDRKISFYEEFDSEPDSLIYIGEIDEVTTDFQRLIIGLITTYAVNRSDDKGNRYDEYVMAKSLEESKGRESRVEVSIVRHAFYRHSLALNDEFLFAERYFAKDNASVFLQFVDAKSNTLETIQKLWDNVALTEGEDEIIRALQIVEPDIVRFSLVGEGRPIVRLRNGQINPLSSMGDGITRVFTIMLALVNCEGNGYLLIDEFENGLHYSVQEKLWEIIFYLAERLNIQVFATTHSNDTIKAFGEVVKSKSEYSDAQLIRLRNIKGEISAISFSIHDIEVANETDYIDLR